MKLVISWQTGREYIHSHIVPTEYESIEAFICDWEKALLKTMEKFEEYSKNNKEHIEKAFEYSKLILKIEDPKKKKQLQEEYKLNAEKREEFFKNNSYQSVEGFYFAGIKFYCLEHIKTLKDKDNIYYPVIETLEEWFEKNNALTVTYG